MSLITEVDILDESKDCFLTYAEEVLTDRAIPAAEDGLLSAQRKILWTMEDYLKMNANSKTKKCNALVGSTLATSYFHGDASCYGVLCKMSQEYLMRYPLICGQGSLGTQENNDMVASSRYTEAKPSIYTDLMMIDYKKNIVPTKETYNGEFMEPVVLPSLFPNALCNGRQAIGISMSHNSAPNNLKEVCDAIIAYLDKGSLTIDEVMQYIKGPDFPLPNTVINKDAIKEAFATGHSKESLKVRGHYEIDGQKIIFTSIPYRAFRNKIREQLTKNVDEFENLLEDFEDESNLGNNRLVFTLKKDASHKTVLNKLFALTDLQTSISYNMNYIVDGTPKLCSIIDLIKAYVKHQSNNIIHSSQYDKDKAEKRKHIVEGLLIAINDIDKAIELIRSSKDKTEAENRLINYFSVTDVQAKAILDMKLAKLTKLDKDDLLDELNSLINIIEESNKIINDENYRNNKISQKVAEMRDKYGDERRTILEQINISSNDKEIAYVEPEKCVVVMSESGLIKRIPASSFKTQRRNGKGVKTTDDIVNCVIRTNTIDSLMVFTDKGTMYRILVDNIPVGNNTTKGTPIKSLIEMLPNENPTLIYSIYRDTNSKYVLFTTKNGLVKKTALEEYVKTKKKTGIAAISFKENDSLANVCLVNEEPIVIVTKNGYVVEFDSKEVAATGRTTMGSKGITLGVDDEVITTLPIRNSTDSLAIFTENGMGKKVSPKERIKQTKGCKGVFYYKPTPATGKISAATLVENDDNVLIIGQTNSICINANEIPELSKSSIGNVLIKGNIKAVSKI